VAHADLDPHSEWVTIRTSWNEKELIKQVPGTWWGPARGRASLWFAPMSWATCVMLRGIFGDTLTVGETLNDWAYTELKRISPSLVLRQLTEPTSDCWFDYGAALYPFQRVGAEWLEIAGDALLGDEMGTGKTIQALAALEHIGVDDVLPAVVICPNSVKKNWAAEIERWFPGARAVVITGTAAVKKRLIDGPCALDPKTITIINFEAVRSFSRLAPYGSTRLKRCRECDRTNGEAGLTVARCQVHPKTLNQIPFKTVIVDEAHRMKDPQSQQTRACWAVMHGATVRRRWALTGTPMANHPGDLWSIMHGVCQREYPAKSKFVDRYALTGWNAYGGLDIVGLNPEHRDEFYKIFDPRFRRMPKAAVLDQLPPKVRQRRYVELPPKLRRAYQQMDEALVTRLDDGSLIVAASNLSAQTRLLQFSSAYATVNDDHVTLTEPSPKLDELDEIYEELGVFEGSGRPIVVCAEHRQLIDLAAARLTKRKLPFGLITGGQKEWERDLALREFQAGHLPVLLFTIKAGGVGLTMTAADTIVFVQRSWSMIDNVQAEDRVHRIGSEVHESVNVIDIIAQDTVEETQLDRLDEKMFRLQEITRDRVQLILSGKDTSELDALESRILASNLGNR
jgi:SNF2 family DNA or RNA helicase